MSLPVATKLYDYTDLTETVFPNFNDNQKKLFNLASSDMPIIARYYNLYNSGDLTGARQVLTSNPQLENKLFNANDYNHLADGIVAIERYISNFLYRSGFGLNMRFCWRSDAVYSVDDCVIHSNSLWKCVINNSNSEPTKTNSNWEFLMDLKCGCEDDDGNNGTTPVQPADKWEVGDIVLFSKNIVEDGYLPCDGRTIDLEEYPDLEPRWDWGKSPAVIPNYNNTRPFMSLKVGRYVERTQSPWSKVEFTGFPPFNSSPSLLFTLNNKIYRTYTPLLTEQGMSEPEIYIYNITTGVWNKWDYNWDTWPEPDQISGHGMFEGLGDMVNTYENDGMLWAAFLPPGAINNTVIKLRLYNPSINTWLTYEGTDAPFWEIGGPSVFVRGFSSFDRFANKIYFLAPKVWGEGEKFWMFNTSNFSWTTLADCPYGATVSSCVAINGKIYVTGSSQSPLTQLRAYDIETNTWSTLPNCPFIPLPGSAATVNGRMYVVGDGKRVAEYKPITNTWRELSPPDWQPFQVNHQSPVVIGSKIYFLDQYSDCFYVYDPTKDPLITN